MGCIDELEKCVIFILSKFPDLFWRLFSSYFYLSVLSILIQILGARKTMRNYKRCSLLRGGYFLSIFFKRMFYYT